MWKNEESLAGALNFVLGWNKLSDRCSYLSRYVVVKVNECIFVTKVFVG